MSLTYEPSSEPLHISSDVSVGGQILVIFAAVLGTETIDEEGTSKVKALMTRLNQVPLESSTLNPEP